MQPELSFEEILTARGCFTKHAEDKITGIHQLRSILGDLGQHPSVAEMETVMSSFGHKVSFDDFCRYLTWLKRIFMKPEPRDADTVRAFVALGGKQDRGGDVNADDLRSACRRFQLTIDIDAMLKEVDEDGSGSIEYSEFRSMWDEEAAGGGGGGVQFSTEDESQSELEMLAALREFLVAKAKENTAALQRQQSVLKRKQSSKVMEARKSTMRVPPNLPSLSPAKKQDDANKGAAGEQVESDPEPEAPAKQEVKERVNPNANDPVYRRYLMTDPIVVGQKKSARRTGPAALPPVTTPRSARGATRASSTPRKSTTTANTTSGASASTGGAASGGGAAE